MNSDLRVALIAAGAGVFGALAGAGSALLVAERQFDAQEQQSEREFNRSQRQAAYSSMLAAVARFDHVHLEFFLELTDYLTRRSSEGTMAEAPENLRALSDEADSAVAEIQVALANVQLVGSEDSLNAAGDIYVDLLNEDVELEHMAGFVVSESPDGDEQWASAEQTLRDARAEMMALRTDFILAARADILGESGLAVEAQE